MILLFLFLFGSLIRTNHILACTVLSAAAPLLSDTPVRFTNLFVLSAEKNIVLLFSFFWRQNLFSESAAHRLFHPCWQNLCHDRFALTLHRYGRPSDGSRFFRAAAIKERNICTPKTVLLALYHVCNQFARLFSQFCAFRI